MSPTLTDRLLHHPPTATLYQRATQSAFLALAGQGRLPRAGLARWLAQDRLYAQAYARFIGGLVSRVRLPAAPSPPVTETAEWRVLEVLRAALDGITTELCFFETTARAYGLDLSGEGFEGKGEGEGEGKGEGVGPNEVTARYVALFDSFGAEAVAIAADGTAGPGMRRTLLEGLLVLWATEAVYLAAWTYAKEQGADGGDGNDQDGGALRKEFIPNWTSEPFQAFVKQTQICFDEYAAANGGTWFEARAIELWTEVLELEEQFWPNVNLKDVASTV